MNKSKKSLKIKRILPFVVMLTLMFSLYVPAQADDETKATVTVNDTTTDYSSLSKAWSAAVSAGNSSDVTFTLYTNWVADSSSSFGSGTGFSNGALYYNGSHNLTIDLNGCAIDRDLYKPQDNGAVIYVDSTLTVVDSKSDEYTYSNLFKGGAIANGSSHGRGGGVSIGANGTFNFYGGTILNCVSTADGGGVSLMESGAKLNVNGGSFYGNRTYDSNGECRGGAINCENGQVVLKNSVFEGNYAEDNAGAIYIKDGSLKAYNCKFYSNTAREEGGAVFVNEKTKSKFEECLFSENDTDDDGGAVYCDAEIGKTYFYNCQMFYNHAGKSGGGIYINCNYVFVIGGDYEYNTADEHGGGIYVDSLVEVNAAEQLVVKNNTVSGIQNDICLQNGTASEAHLYCGGFYEGSSVGLCSTDKKTSQLVIKGIDKYQYNNYIFFDEGYAEEKVESSAVSSDNIRAEASAFSDITVLIILICALVAVALAVFAVVYGRKKKGAKIND